MGAERIIEKIKADAAAEAAGIKAQAEEKAASTRAAILAKAKEQAQQIEKSAQAGAEEVRRRQMLIAGLEARKNTLAQKRAVVDEAFVLAGKELSSLPEDRWATLILRVVLENCETGSEYLRVPASDREKYESGILSRLSAELGKGGSLLDIINVSLQERGKKGWLKLDPEPAPFEDGVMIVGEKSDVDCSFEALLREARDQYEREVAALLFSSEVQ